MKNLTVLSVSRYVAASTMNWECGRGLEVVKVHFCAGPAQQGDPRLFREHLTAWSSTSNFVLSYPPRVELPVLWFDWPALQVVNEHVDKVGQVANKLTKNRIRGAMLSGEALGLRPCQALV